MNSSPIENSTIDASLETGLAAIGTFGAWEIEVDETISGEEQWFLQITGPASYHYFQIPSPSTIEQVLAFLQRKPSQGSEACSCSTELEMGKFHESTVRLLWDEENNCCSIWIGGAGANTFFTLNQENLLELIEALKEAEMDLSQ